MDSDGHPRFPNLFQPLQVGPVTLRNRVTIPAHQPRLAKDSLPSDAYIEYHRTRARGGAAMQSTGNTAVVKAALAEVGPVRLANVDDRIIPGYQRLAAAVHGEGGRILAQLGHMGATAQASNMIVLSASWVVSEVSRDVARAISEEEMQELRDGFQAAAARCRLGDLDGVEVLMYTGNLLVSFLSPFSNHRQDQWGGSLENRMRFPMAIVEAVREGLGTDRVVGIKLTVDEFVEGGIELPQGVEIARRFADSGLIDYLSVTVGNNLTLASQKRDRWPTGSVHGEFRPQSRAVKQAVGRLPVCYIGGVTDLQMAEEIVASGDADLVGMVRAHIADPEVVRKGSEGRLSEIRPCIHSNVCINVTHGRKAVRCISNPEVGEELTWADAYANRGPAHHAVVVGAGPGGLEAARVLAELGHRVTLFERESFLGGQMYRWSSARYLNETRRVIGWWSSRLKALGVDVRLGEVATVEAVSELRPDLVIVATGSRPMAAPVPAGEGSTVRQLDVWQGLDGLATGRALIVDDMGRQDAFHVTERLVETCSEVYLITSCIHVGEGEGVGTLPQTLTRTEQLKVRIIERARPRRVDGSRVEVRGLFGGEPRIIEDVDSLVYWRGGVSETELGGQLRAAGVRVELIGDAVLPRRVYDAVQEGATLARTAFAEQVPALAT
jgi:dimethylglycine catabolism A